MENEMRFRALLLKLQDSLSDNDRQKLHFLIGSIIPRRVRDDATTKGTLKLFELLFDCGKITDQKFDFLIEAFEGIDRHDIAGRLRAYAESIGIERIAQSSLSQLLLMDAIEEDTVAFPSLQQNVTRLQGSLATGRVPDKTSRQRSVMNPLPSVDPRRTFTERTHLLLILVKLVLIVNLCVLVATTLLVRRGTSSISIPPPTTTVRTAMSDVHSKTNKRADCRTHSTGDTDHQPLRGNFNQLQKLKEKHPHLRTLISVGGDAGSGPFHHVAATPRNRSVFAESCLTFLRHYDLDRLYSVLGESHPRIHWPENKQNYVSLLQELHRQLNTASEMRYLLTIAGGRSEKIKNLDLAGTIGYLDMLTYEGDGTWETQMNHHTPLYSSDAETLRVDATAQAYLDRRLRGAYFWELSAGRVRLSNRVYRRMQRHGSAPGLW